MLDVDTVIPFLLEQNLVDRDWIVQGRLTVRSAARRNRNLRVEGPGGAGLLVKQPDALSPASSHTLRNEAHFYDFCHNEPAAAELARYLPGLRWLDREDGAHALELIPGAGLCSPTILDTRPMRSRSRPATPWAGRWARCTGCSAGRNWQPTTA